jgi:hypothetical protein
MTISIIPTRDEFEIIQTIAKAASESKYFDKMGGLSGMLSIALYAREMGIPPLSALFGGMQNVMGKIQMSPEMMMSLIRGKGHKIEILECNDTICKIKGTRKDTAETYVAIYAIAEATAAGLVKQGSGWTKNPSDMLFARASGRLKRRLFPDVATKAYCEGELEEVISEKTVTMEAVKEEFQAFSPEILPPKELFITTDQALILNDLVGENEVLRKNVLEWQKIEAFHQLPVDRFDKIYDVIMSRLPTKKIEVANAETY